MSQFAYKKKSQIFVLIYKCWCSFAISELFVTNLKAATGEKIIPDFQNTSTVTGLPYGKWAI